MPGTRAAIATGLLALVFATGAVAQQTGSYRVGFLSPASPAGMQQRVEAFRKELQQLGYVEGQNLLVNYRWAEGRNDRLASLAAELAALKPTILVAHGAIATKAAEDASSAVPIVCFACGDMVEIGFVANLARPNGRITGQTVIAPEMIGKRVQLLKEVVPALARVAVLWNPTNPVNGPELKETEDAAATLGLQIQSLAVTSPPEIETAIAGIQGSAGALIVLSDAMMNGQYRKIAELTIDNQLPSISWTVDFARAGGMLSYGPDVITMAHRAAHYVDRLLQGTPVGELPVERPTTFELAINARTAKALGLAVPGSLLASADEVID